MTITLSDDQYRRIVILTMLGEWMVNATRKEPDGDFEFAASQLYAFAKGTPAEPLVTYDEESTRWIPSDTSDDEVHTLIDDYDDKTFWEDLTTRMAERDLTAERGERAVNGMRPAERLRAIEAAAKKYVDEFEHHGLERLLISEKLR
jgi:hypothetical protein